MCSYENEDNITNLVSWKPEEKQWWITGFNPSYSGNVDASKQVMICSVDFSSNEEMYTALKNTADFKSAFFNDKILQYGIFDNNNKTLWIVWYGKDFVK